MHLWQNRIVICINIHMSKSEKLIVVLKRICKYRFYTFWVVHKTFKEKCKGILLELEVSNTQRHYENLFINKKKFFMTSLQIVCGQSIHHPFVHFGKAVIFLWSRKGISSGIKSVFGIKDKTPSPIWPP